MIDLTQPISIFTFSVTDREFCFSVTIIDDIQFEANEVFTIVARENPPLYTDIALFMIPTDTVQITVEDTDSKLVMTP